ncbi:hypothetical protein EGW08_003453 [Elysia chlorotica]|uniref:Uncharacterized protein n=1 Tax=Elysia chlorotica TaxID=188477 RepID=A0A3S1A2C8_ELYCH|nr:hypothetical protein EGW08_003453 [Elysia chlorotica]
MRLLFRRAKSFQFAPVSLSIDLPGVGAPDFFESAASSLGLMSRTEVSLDVEPNSSAQETCFSPWLARLCVFLYLTPSASPKDAGRLVAKGPGVMESDEETMEGKNTPPCQGFDRDLLGVFSALSGESTSERAAFRVGFGDDDGVDGEDGDDDNNDDEHSDDTDDDHVGESGGGDNDIGDGVREDDKDREVEQADFLEQAVTGGNVGEGVRDRCGFSKCSGVTMAL